MSYSDETVLSKLSALNETQEGIVSIAQWVMFHRYAFAPPLHVLLRVYFLKHLLFIGGYSARQHATL